MQLSNLGAFAPGPFPASFSCRRPARAPCRAASTPAAPASKLNDPWQRATDMMFQGTVAEGVIKGVNKGGVLVQLGDVVGFMPYTKLAPERLKPGHKGDLSYLVGQKVKARVVQVDTQGARKELVLSERQAELTEAIRALQPGQVVSGAVIRLEDYGALVALEVGGRPSGVTGLIHKSELSWEQVINVNDVLSTGQQVSAQVLKVDASRLRVSLSLRALAPDPLRETIETLTWRETSGDSELLPQVAAIVALLRLEAGISGVEVGKQAEEKHVVAQDLELYLTKEDVEGGFALVARCGRLLQELRVSTSLGRDDMKKALTRVLGRVR